MSHGAAASALCTAIWHACVLHTLLLVVGRAGVSNKPNFVVFLVDDLDHFTNHTAPDYMPALDKHLRKQGVEFTNYFVTTPICCPSRVNLLTGRHSHNTNFTDVLGPHGGYRKFKGLGLDKSYLPTWLQALGYNTYYSGKFIVDYTIHNYSPHPLGWTDFDALVTPFLFSYYTPAFSRNGREPVMYPDQYSTDIVGAKALAQVEAAAAEAKPFYIQIAPPAPHHSIHYDYNDTGSLVSKYWFPPMPAYRHWHLYAGTEIPRLDNFNEEDVGDKPLWVRQLDSLNRSNISFLDETYRLRLRSLRAVDELIVNTVEKLESLGILNNTYLVFTSDNGYHHGSHRQGNGKLAPYQEDIQVPFIIKGPGLEPGNSPHLGQHVDLPATILSLAGGSLPSELDGTPLPLPWAAGSKMSAQVIDGDAAQVARALVSSEFWGLWDDEAFRERPRYANFTWKAVHVPVQLATKHGKAFKYIVYCSGERELYDLGQDPAELDNLLQPLMECQRLDLYATANVSPSLKCTEGSPSHVSENAISRSSSSHHVHPGTNMVLNNHDGHAGHDQHIPQQSSRDGEARSRTDRALLAAVDSKTQARGLQLFDGINLSQLEARLNALLSIMAVCQGWSCRQPFKVLHPEGDVFELAQAMDSKYDQMYASIPSFHFKQCLPYYDSSNEVSAFRDRLVSGGSVTDQGMEDPHPQSTSAAHSEWREPPQIASSVDAHAVALPSKYKLVTDFFGQGDNLKYLLA